ncbi:rhamnogalacturonan acetylesterase [Maribellus sediminis]|uniref:rhamnogalacturonan acetylesterase n=1 Tax=Maribellus sediminis TaxID=2696285 RepID=UPI001430E7A0|nr:rhamnogalacturonan acetylesterase [Maribellus sediminis]
MRLRKIAAVIIVIALFFACQSKREDNKKITIYTIGDSTVKNGQGDGAGGLWGWGDPLVQYFDTATINLENHALGGTSSRTYRDKGLWQPVLDKLKPGDYVLMQFGHNDAGPVNDTIRARGTIQGTGDETEEIDNLLIGKHEIVHTYGWYMRQFIREAKEKGAIPVVMSPIPRNNWKDGKVPRNKDSYGGWAKTVAEEEGAFFIDLNEKMASRMEQRGEENVTEVLFFSRDHTHTSAKGAVLAASLIVEGLKELDKCKLKNYLLENPKISFPVKKKVFIIGDSTVANGKDNIIGWGRELGAFLDTSRIEVINKARGGRSSRTYMYEGLWDEVLAQLNEGDFLLIQFGHNDGGNIDKAKYRGSLKGMGDETQEILRNDSIPETVHTYGWYMTTYITQAKEKGVSVIVVSMIPRNIWHDGKVERVDDSYGGWAKEAAEKNEAFFIDLNNVVADKYEQMGPEKVKAFFPGDHTHTNADGAKFNAKTLAEEVRKLRTCSLRRYLK